MQSIIPHDQHDYEPTPFPFNLFAETLLRLSAAMLAPMDLSPANFTPRFGVDPQTPVTEHTGQTHSSLIAFSTAHRSTDLATLTPQQIHELNQNMLNEVSDTFRPLISDVTSISVLRDEYQSTSFTSQIDSLQSKGYNGILRTRGDGDCFYRCELITITVHRPFSLVACKAIGFAYIEQIINSPDPTVAAANALSNLEKSQGLLDQAGFQKVVYEDFYDAFASMIKEVATATSPDGIMNHTILISAFQNPEGKISNLECLVKILTTLCEIVSNSVVVYLRLLASAQIQADAENYEPFLLHPELGEPLNAKDFCSQFVEAIGKEADHVQVAALSRALKLNVQVAYLDGRSAVGFTFIFIFRDVLMRLINQEGRIDFVPFENTEDHKTVQDVILLYR
jgi:ubiquitin thioesterase protein OTUB1